MDEHLSDCEPPYVMVIERTGPRPQPVSMVARPKNSLDRVDELASEGSSKALRS